MAQYEVGSNVVSDIARDEEFKKALHMQVSEAAERVTFHRTEAERWERLGRAGQAALRELEAATPVPQQTPDGFLHDAPAYR